MEKRDTAFVRLWNGWEEGEGKYKLRPKTHEKWGIIKKKQYLYKCGNIKNYKRKSRICKRYTVEKVEKKERKAGIRTRYTVSI